MMNTAFPFQNRLLVELVHPSSLIQDKETEVTYRDPFGRLNHLKNALYPFHFNYFEFLWKWLGRLFPIGKKNTLFEKVSFLENFRKPLKNLFEWTDNLDCKLSEEKLSQLKEITMSLRSKLDMFENEEVVVHLPFEDYIETTLTQKHPYALFTPIFFDGRCPNLLDSIMDDLVLMQLKKICSDLEIICNLGLPQTFPCKPDIPFYFQFNRILYYLNCFHKTKTLKEIILDKWKFEIEKKSYLMEEDAEIIFERIVTVNLDNKDISHESMEQHFFEKVGRVVDQVIDQFGGITLHSLLGLFPSVIENTHTEQGNLWKVYNLKKGILLNPEKNEYSYYEIEFKQPFRMVFG